MSQTAVQKSQSIRLGSVTMSLDNVNIGLLEEAQLEVVYNVIDLRAHNGKLPPRKKIESVRATASLWELFLDNIAKIDSHGVFTNVAATPIAITNEAKGTGWTVGQPIRLSNKNGANTVVSSIVVKAGGSTITLNTDYRVYVADGSNGDTGYAYIVPLTAQTLAITVDYSYTPNAKKTATWSDVTKLISLYELKMVNTDENGKNLTITIPKGYSAGNMTWGFVSDDAVDEVMKMPFEFQAFPDDQNRLLVIEDEQAV